jgi:hypothetical protein
VSGETDKKSNYSTNGLIISRSFRLAQYFQMHSMKIKRNPETTPSISTMKQLKMAVISIILQHVQSFSPLHIIQIYRVINDFN